MIARADPGRGRRRRPARRATSPPPARSPPRTARCCGSTRSRPAWAGPALVRPRTTSGVVPDVVTLAKGLGGGIPIGALHRRRRRRRRCSSPATTAPRSAATRSPCAAALAVIDTIEKDGLLDHVDRGRGAPARRPRRDPRVDRGPRPRAAPRRSTCRRAGLRPWSRARWTRGFIVNDPTPDRIRLAPPLMLTDEHAARSWPPGRRSSTLLRRGEDTHDPALPARRRPEPGRAGRGARAWPPQLKAAPYDGSRSTGPQHGRDDLRQADAAHPGLVRRGHRRAGRLPDARRRPLAGIGPASPSPTSPGCSAGRSPPSCGGPTPRPDRGDGGVRRRAGRQRADRRLPPVPAPRRPADHHASTRASSPASTSPSSATAPATWATPTCSPARPPACTSGQRTRGLPPGPDIVERAPEIAADDRRVRRRVDRDPHEAVDGCRRRHHRHLGLDGQGGRGRGASRLFGRTPVTADCWRWPSRTPSCCTACRPTAARRSPPTSSTVRRASSGTRPRTGCTPRRPSSTWLLEQPERCA